MWEAMPIDVDHAIDSRTFNSDDERLGWSFASAPAQPFDRRVATAVAVVSAVVFAAVVPMVGQKLPEHAAFIPAFESAVAINDVVAAALLLGQFREARRPSLLLLMASFIFTACIVMAHLLSFPGLAGPGSLFGGPQTTAWLWVAWHVTPPIVVTGYALMVGGRHDPALPPTAARRAAMLAIVLPCLATAACILVATNDDGFLPPLVVGSNFASGLATSILAAPMVLSLVAVVTLAVRTRLMRALDLWLAVAAGAWAVEILISALLTTGRFEVGWYVGRLYGLLASGVVLASLLFTAAAMHQRLARALLLERARAAELQVSEAALRHAQKMEAVGQLTSGVAHDFNNLLMGISGALDLLVREPLSDRGQRMVTLALQSVARGASLTRQLVAFARQQSLYPAAVDLNALTAEMLDLLCTTLGATVQIELLAEPNLPLAFADRVQVEVVMLNLAINARDAMPHGGSITIRTGVAETGEPERAEDPPAGTWVILEVADTGDGMPADVLTRVFEPFFTTKAIGRGSGLGLSQVLGVAKQLGGGVQIRSAAGEGCAVRLFLPLAAANEAANEAGLVAPNATAVDARAMGSLGGTRVLLVDDDIAVRTVARAMLEDLGCAVVEAACGASALDLLRSSMQTGYRIDAALIDYAMPGLNGLETTRQALLMVPDLPVLLATGYADARDIAAAVPSLAGVIHKPFRRSDLLERLGPMLARDVAASAG